MNSIGAGSHVQAISASPSLAGAAARPAGAEHSFAQHMLDAIDHVNQMQLDANHAVEQLAAGGEVNAAEVFTSLQRADMTFRMMLQIRNKLMQAYQEIQQIRI